MLVSHLILTQEVQKRNYGYVLTNMLWLGIGVVLESYKFVAEADSVIRIVRKISSHSHCSVEKTAAVALVPSLSDMVVKTRVGIKLL